MADSIYVDSIKVYAGPFTAMTGLSGRAVVRRADDKGTSQEWDMTLEDLELLYRAIGEYLHMRSLEDA